MYKWIKITTDFFNDEKIQLIEALPNGDTLIVIWVKLLCLAGKRCDGGAFTINGKSLTAENLATILRRPIEDIKEAVNIFIDYGMIEWERNISDPIKIKNWNKHQSMEEVTREKNRQRQAAYRQRRNVTCNVTNNTAESCRAVISYLNIKLGGADYDPEQEETVKLINDRMKEGYTVADMQKVIDNKCADWLGTEWAKYLRPSTLFGKKFESYLKAPKGKKKSKGSVYSAEGASFDVSKYEKDSLFDD